MQTVSSVRFCIRVIIQLLRLTENVLQATGYDLREQQEDRVSSALPGIVVVNIVIVVQNINTDRYIGYRYRQISQHTTGYSSVSLVFFLHLVVVLVL